MAVERSRKRHQEITVEAKSIGFGNPLDLVEEGVAPMSLSLCNVSPCVSGHWRRSERGL